MSFWLADPPLQEARNAAQKGDSDFGVSSNPDDPRFDEKKHKRGKKGTSSGGKFVKKDGGDTGEEEAVQTILGVADKAVLTAQIRAYQRKHGLTVDGIVGRQTARALNGDIEGARKTKIGAMSSGQAERLRATAGRTKAKRQQQRASSRTRRSHLRTRAAGGTLVEEYDPAQPRDRTGKWTEKPGVPEYDPSPLVFGGSAGGTTGARVATHADGGKWLVKTYQGNEDRVATELAANAVYRAMGAKVARAGRIRLHNGRQALSYPFLEGDVKVHALRKKPGGHPDLRRHFLTDALLANWDVAGMDDDNVLWDPEGKPFRVDQGGTLEFRAQGGRRDYGPVPNDLVTMLKPGGQGRRTAGKITLDEMRDQAKEIAERLTPEVIDSIVDGAGFRSKGMRERVRKNLKARVKWFSDFTEKEAVKEAAEEPPSLLEAVSAPTFNWSEHEHPRDQFGKFRKKLSSLPVGGMINLGNKTYVKRDKDGTYRVVRSGQIIRGFRTPGSAVRAALDRSVKGKDAEEVGGFVKYKDFNAYLEARGFDAGSAGAFNGRVGLTLADLKAERAELTQEFLAIQGQANQGDKYAERALPTLDARLDEINDKVKAMEKGEPIAKASPAPAGPSTSLPATGIPDGYSYDTTSVTKTTLAMKEKGYHSPFNHPNGSAMMKKSAHAKGADGDPTPYWRVAIEGKGLRNYKSRIQASKALVKGEHTPGYSYEDDPYAPAAPEVDLKTKTALEKFPTGTAIELPNGKVVTLGKGSKDVIEVTDADGEKYDVDADTVIMSKLPEAKPAGAPEVTVHDLPEGTTFKNSKTGDLFVKKTSSTGNAILVSKGPSSGLTGTQPGEEVNLGSAPIFQVVTQAPEVAKPAKKKFGKNHKQPNLPHPGIKTDPDKWHPDAKAPLKDLELSVGDKVQFKKGGWTYEYAGTTLGAGGNKLKFKDPKGATKTWAGYAKPQSVIKADGSELKYGTPEGVAPPAPSGEVVPGFPNLNFGDTVDTGVGTYEVIKPLPGQTIGAGAPVVFGLTSPELSGPAWYADNPTLHKNFSSGAWKVQKGKGGASAGGATAIPGVPGFAFGGTLDAYGAKYDLLKPEASAPSGAIFGVQLKGKSNSPYWYQSHDLEKINGLIAQGEWKFEGTPATGGVPAPKGPDLDVPTLKQQLKEPSGDVKIADYPDGTVIKSLDGKALILKTGEDAYNKGQAQGYVAAYDIETGAKVEVPAWKKPVGVSVNPVHMKAAAAHLAKSGKTDVSKTKVAAGGGSASDVGPPPKFSGVPSDHAAINKLSSWQSGNGSKMTSEEKQATSYYTNGGYDTMNGALRNSTSVKNLDLAKRISALKKAIEKSEPFKEPVLLSRRTNVGVWKDAATVKVGSVIQDNGFLSTSAEQGTWSGDVWLKILAPAGSRGLWVNTTGGSSHPSEQEVILPPGSQFHVLKREEKGSSTVLYVELIP